MGRPSRVQIGGRITYCSCKDNTDCQAACDLSIGTVTRGRCIYQVVLDREDGLYVCSNYDGALSVNMGVTK